MAKYTSVIWVGKHLFVGIDIHRKEWNVTILTEDQLKVFSNRIPGDWRSLKRVLDKYKKEVASISVVYEAGFSGYWLRDYLVQYGANITITPPNKIPFRQSRKDLIERFHGDVVASSRIGVEFSYVSSPS